MHKYTVYAIILFMTESTDPFKDNKDPFVPETVRVSLPDGTDAIDLGATAMNHIEAPLPKIDSSNLSQGDVLTVEFDNDHKETFEVGALHISSLVFGSDDVMSQEVVLKRHTEDTDEPLEETLHGSAISPYGTMMTPGTIRVGSYMVVDSGISAGVIRSFDIRRPDENGDLQPVALNKNERKAPSDSFTNALQSFKEIEALLEADDFRFDDTEEDIILEDGYVLEGGLSKNYKRVNGDLLVYASRQGFGCAVIPQDEIWVYDAKDEVLRAMRNIPTQGIFQMAIAEGVTKDMFQEAGIGYSSDGTPDWRESFCLEGPTLHRLSKDAPITSYTWMSPDQDAPIITVLEDGENVSDLLKTPKQKGEAFVEVMKAHGGEDLIESVHEALGIDPGDESYIYDRLEVNIRPGEEPEPCEAEAHTWTSEELAASITQKVKDATSIAYTKDGAILSVDGHDIHVRTEIDKEIKKMVKAARLTSGKTQRAIGSRLMRWLRE